MAWRVRRHYQVRKGYGLFSVACTKVLRQERAERVLRS